VGNVNAFVGALGGTILCLELLVLLLLLVAINAGMAFGLWFVLKKMGFVHRKLAWATGRVESIVDKASNIAAAPVIRTTSAWRGLRATAYRATHWPPRPAVTAAPAPAKLGQATGEQRAA